MNKLKLDNTGGFPLDTNVLDFMQNSYQLFNHLGHLAGDLAIISGCKVTGSSVSDGVVFIGGELLPFKGGSAFTSVIIKEEKRALPFEDGESKEVEITRYATFGAGTNTYPWADFKRPPSLSALEDHLIRLFSEKAETEDLARAEQRLGALETKKIQWSEVEQKPTSFPVEAHTHPFSDITDLPYKIVAAGLVDYRTRRATKFIGDFTVSAVMVEGRSRPDYTDLHRIHHNLGHTKYMVVGQVLGGFDQRFIKFNAYDNRINYCDVGTSDDASGNASNFVFAIIEFKN
ncbi:hypothetical protein EDL99_09815 [Ornithobacterium rhinotracheale]|uniref:hypothetical protein n=1 Tax=Ornithobacterium rhinotracheale TaxID=28251 RepID=UPI00129CEF58|nr:hypothetical protein [Ornithobacterium rhinotracheale]MRJ09152.1 hypothetical protein [Ornithobacterium rhinotracheale]UOH77263.1 hypothetical protein MT996_08575 [Ornithobacterium rhinotracheale]